MTAVNSLQKDHAMTANTTLTNASYFTSLAVALAMIFAVIVPLTQGDTIVSADPVGMRKRDTGSIVYAPDYNGPYYLGTQYYSDGAIHDEQEILIPFDLTGVGTIVAATFYSRPDYVYTSPIQYNIDLYGVGYNADSGTLPDAVANLFYVGALDGTASMLLDDHIVPTPTNNAYVSGTSSALIDYLNNRTDDIVWLRLNHDASVAYVGPTGNESYHIRFDPTVLVTGDYPYLDLTTAIPEPGTVCVLALGLYAAIGMRRRRTA